MCEDGLRAAGMAGEWTGQSTQEEDLKVESGSCVGLAPGTLSGDIQCSLCPVFSPQWRWPWGYCPLRLLTCYQGYFLKQTLCGWAKWILLEAPGKLVVRLQGAFLAEKPILAGFLNGLSFCELTIICQLMLGESCRTWNGNKNSQRLSEAIRYPGGAFWLVTSSHRPPLGLHGPLFTFRTLLPAGVQRKLPEDGTEPEASTRELFIFLLQKLCAAPATQTGP